MPGSELMGASQESPSGMAAGAPFAGWAAGVRRVGSGEAPGNLFWRGIKSAVWGQGRLVTSGERLSGDGYLLSRHQVAAGPQVRLGAAA